MQRLLTLLVNQLAPCTVGSCIIAKSSLLNRVSKLKPKRVLGQISPISNRNYYFKKSTSHQLLQDSDWPDVSTGIIEDGKKTGQTANCRPWMSDMYVLRWLVNTVNFRKLIHHVYAHINTPGGRSGGYDILCGVHGLKYRQRTCNMCHTGLVIARGWEGLPYSKAADYLPP